MSCSRDAEIVAAIFRASIEQLTEGDYNPSQQDAWAWYSDDFGPCPVRFATSYNTINEN